MDIVATQISSLLQDTVVIWTEVFSLVKQALLRAVPGLTGLGVIPKIHSKGHALLVGLAVCLASCLVVFLQEGHWNPPTKDCPAALVQIAQRQVSPGGPTELLAQAEAAANSSEKLSLAAKCVAWGEPSKTPPLNELVVQLRCQTLLLAEMEAARSGSASDESFTLAKIGRKIVSRAEAVRRQCEVTNKRLINLQGLLKAAGASSSAAAKLPYADGAVTELSALVIWETQVHETMEALLATREVLAERMAQGDWNAEDVMYELAPMRIEFTNCLLKTAREARNLAQIMPQHDPGTKKLVRCRPDLLNGLHNLAVESASGENSTDPGVKFEAGLLLSDMAVATEETPLLVTTKDLSLDARGFLVTADIARAEELMADSLTNSIGPETTERASMSAIRLSQHARHLLQQQRVIKREINIASADWRYRAAAEVAERFGRNKLASHILGQLAHMYFTQGRHWDLLEVTNKALELYNDTLASYLDVSTRFDMGLLQSPDELRYAALQLEQLEGKVSFLEAEDARAMRQSVLERWLAVDESSGYEPCLTLGDVAQTMICLFGRAAY